MGNEDENDNKISQLEHEGVRWLDVRSGEPAVFERLKSDFHLHPLHLTESIQRIQHTEVEREDNYLFFVLRFPMFDQGTYKVLSSQVGIFLGRDFLITIHTTECPTIEKLFDKCRHDQTYFSKGSDYLLYELINRMLSNVSAMTDYVESELDGLEDIVFNNDKSDALPISQVRQKIVRLSRVIGPKRFVLEDLAQQIDSFSGHNVSRYYSNNVKTVNRLWEVVEEARDTVEIYKDADFTTSTEKTNRTLMLLTLAFTFTIPITVISTLYGMNVLLPGGIEAGSWLFFGKYTSFVILLVFSLVLTISMHFYFKKKKWF